MTGRLLLDVMFGAIAVDLPDGRLIAVGVTGLFGS